VPASTVKVYRYDPVANVGDDTPADLPATRWGSASGLYGGNWILAGGYVTDVISNSAVMYNFGTNTWSPIDSKINARARLGGGGAGGAFYAVGGRAGVPEDGSKAITPNKVGRVTTGKAAAQPEGFTGTNTNQRYLIQVGCPTNTPTLTPTPQPTCGPDSPYIVTTATATIEAGGTLVTGSQGDDQFVNIPLPFPYTFYDQTYNSVNAITNGNLQFVSTNTTFTNACLPTATMNYLIAPHWDDLLTNAAGDGIFTSTTGVAPNRIFHIEWRACLYSAGVCGGDVDFEVNLYEGQSRVAVTYGTVSGNGAGATIGVQRGTGVQFTQYSCNTASVAPGMQVIFNQVPCGTPTPTPPPACAPLRQDIRIQYFAFAPQNYTIQQGTTIRWTNLDTDSHTSTSDTSVWDSGILAQGASYSFTFNTPGSYPYHCAIHPAMTGTITVLAGCAPSTQLTGHVTWQGVSLAVPHRSIQPLTLTLKSGVNEVNYPLMNTDSSGFFTVPVGLAPGSYDWRVKGSKHLSSCGTVVISAGSNSAEMGTMRAGDAQPNNVVNIGDSNTLRLTFGKAYGDAGYDQRADFNNDHVVNIADQNLLRTNFGIAGCDPVAIRR
jgi:plastocyanin